MKKQEHELPPNSIFGQTNAILTVYGKQIKCRQVILPMPPSENARLEPGAVNGFGPLFANSKRGKSKRMHNSTVYNQWKKQAVTHLRKGRLTPLDGPIGVIITVVFPDYRIRDAQNREKGLFDAMEQSRCLFDNDTNVVFHVTEKRIVKGSSFVLAFVFPMSELGVSDYQINDEYLSRVAEKVPC